MLTDTATKRELQERDKGRETVICEEMKGVGLILKTWANTNWELLTVPIGIWWKQDAGLVTYKENPPYTTPSHLNESFCFHFPGPHTHLLHPVNPTLPTCSPTQPHILTSVLLVLYTCHISLPNPNHSMERFSLRFNINHWSVFPSGYPLDCYRVKSV